MPKVEVAGCLGGGIFRVSMVYTPGLSGTLSVFKGELQMRIGDSLDLSSFLAYILTVYVQLNYRVFYLMYVLYITSLSQVYQT